MRLAKRSGMGGAGKHDDHVLRDRFSGCIPSLRFLESDICVHVTLGSEWMRLEI
jgi:hypothetical protein